MPNHDTAPPQLGRLPDRAPKPVVLLTGASGVVGQALLPRIRDMHVVCLVHRTAVPGTTSLRGDLTQPHLGLSQADYSWLARRADVVIHAGAVTDFNRSDGSLEATNIGGTEQVVTLAEAADARLYHVSTAFLHARADGERGRTAARYAASKRAGEDIVRAATVPHVILRPSVVIGDSRTGWVSGFQGLYLVAAAILGGFVPLIPFDSTWPIDFVPSDVVADAIATAVEDELTSGELWVTTGERALTLDQAVAHVVEFGRQIGIEVDAPRFVPPEMFDRLIGPVFLDALPRRVRLTVLRLLELFTVYLARQDAMPSSLDGATFPDPGQALLTSLGYWAAATGRTAEVA
ncbi:MAG: hypothetical protein QOE93_2526 [Actinomycetota bacterium]|nr:hypothetical protein [Actinomycetota bacterium]